MRWTVIDSPIGDLSLAVDDDGFCGLGFGAVDTGRRLVQDPLLTEAQEELKAYFAGELTEFNLPLSIPHGSEFERAVWAQLCRIPYGEMRSYEDLAVAVGKVRASRAVGRANGQNRIGIVIPCHRVVNKSGKLGGYGGGLWRKEFLLNLERGTNGVAHQSQMWATT